MEDDQHPVESPQVESIPQPDAASPITVAPTFGQKRKEEMADLEDSFTSGHVSKSETNSQQQVIVRQMITLLHSIKDLLGKDGCDKEEDINATVIFGQGCLRIGYTTLKNTSDSSTEHHDHLNMPTKLKQKADGPQDVNGEHIIANTQLMAQAQQLRDSQNRIHSLHTQLFKLRGRLYDIQVEHAHDLADLQREIRESGDRHRKRLKLPSLPRWLTDEEFEPYDEHSTEEGSPVAKIVGGPSSCSLAARRHMSFSRHWALHCLPKAKNTRADVDDSDESDSLSAMHRRANGTPEL